MNIVSSLDTFCWLQVHALDSLLNGAYGLMATKVTIDPDRELLRSYGHTFRPQGLQGVHHHHPDQSTHSRSRSTMISDHLDQKLG